MNFTRTRSHLSTALATPAVTLDRVSTIAIGDPLCHEKTLWNFSDQIAYEVRLAGGTVYAQTVGMAIGSDGVNGGQPERTAIVLAGNIADLDGLRLRLAHLLSDWNMTSACFATDSAHEPIFQGPTGYRPGYSQPKGKQIR